MAYKTLHGLAPTKPWLAFCSQEQGYGLLGWFSLGVIFFFNHSPSYSPYQMFLEVFSLGECSFSRHSLIP